MRLLQAGLIHGAVLLLQGQIRVMGTAEHRSACHFASVREVLADVQPGDRPVDERDFRPPT